MSFKITVFILFVLLKEACIDGFLIFVTSIDSKIGCVWKGRSLCWGAPLTPPLSKHKKVSIVTKYHLREKYINSWRLLNSAT